MILANKKHGSAAMLKGGCYCLENDEDEYIVDENDEYSLIYKYDGSGTYELRDSHNKVIGITEYDTIEEALEDIRNKLGR